MRSIGIGIVGGGYMGKAHAVAMSAVGAIFDTALRPRLEMVSAASDLSAERYRQAYGFARSTGDWRVLVADPLVEAVVIAAPQELHRAVCEAAFALGKSVTLKALVGHQTTERRPDRSYWSLGGEVRWRHLIFDLRYQDTDLSKARCGFNPDICGPALTGAVTAVLPLILF